MSLIGELGPRLRGDDAFMDAGFKKVLPMS
jgi:hypothetical protein